MIAAAIAVTAMLLAACSYPTRNQQATVIDETYGYRWNNLDRSGLDGTLVIVTASGGGTRATALTLSVLRALDRIAVADGTTLAEHIDVISSVSGGSVAAGYFALTGRAGFDTLENAFIRRDGIGALLFSGLNPVGLTRLSTPSEERIDLLIDYLNARLFHGATYQSLIDRRRRPFLLLNAADMVEGVPFPFTQRKMDLLCSDMSRVPLATAVAASAAFPVALSPVTLKNYSPCPATAGKAWPPAWVTVNIDDPGTQQGQSLWHDQPQRASLGRTEYAYALGNKPGVERPKLYVHLLDGGIADNLGLFEPFRMLTTRDTDPSFLGEIDRQRVRKLIFISINARSVKPSTLDGRPDTPSALDMLLASISAPIDRTTAGTASQLRVLLEDEFRQMTLGDAAAAARFHELARNTALVSIDFDAIVDEECRRRFHSIATSWTLDPRDIDALFLAGGALLQSDPEFQHLLDLSGGRLSASLPEMAQACSAVRR